MTPAEMKAKGYTARQEGNMVRVYQHNEYVAALSGSPYNGYKLGFDWHRHDQWHLRSWHVTALLAEGRQ